jgi:hypothetical protein
VLLKKTLYILSLCLVWGQENIAEGLTGSALIQYLSDNYKTGSTLSYNAARDAMYGNVDNHNGVVYGIYTNYSVSNVPENNPRPTVHEGGLNCEHVWPQSMYSGSDPESDMHIIRPCKANVNTSRGNKPFNENSDSQTNSWYWLNQNLSSIPTSNIDEYSESETAFFEPREDRKGDIARTIFYFYTMYSEVADENFFETQKNTMKLWHELDPADENEIERTWNIASYQQNKPNPFILDSTLISRAYFYNEVILGDVNTDQVLDVLDVVAIVAHILGGIPLSSPQDTIADLNSDSAVNVLDVVMLVDIILS